MSATPMTLEERERIERVFRLLALREAAYETAVEAQNEMGDDNENYDPAVDRAVEFACSEIETARAVAFPLFLDAARRYLDSTAPRPRARTDVRWLIAAGGALFGAGIGLPPWPGVITALGGVIVCWYGWKRSTPAP